MTTINKIGAAVLGLALTTMGFSSCSNGDWEFDDYAGGTSAYFAMQTPIRTITLGNDDDAVNVDDNNHQFKLQAVMGGVYSNNRDRNIIYKIAPEKLEKGSGMEVLPESYYELANPNTLTIPSGAVIGGTVVKLKDAFFNDPKAATTHYVLPVELVSSNDIDTILKEKNYQLLCLKYKNENSGLYSRTGTTVIDGLNQTATHKNEDALWTVSTVDMKTSILSVNDAFNVYKKNDKGVDVVDATYTVDFTVTLAFSADGTCKVLHDGKEVGTGSFVQRGIQDFSDVNRKADCLKLSFTVNAKVNSVERKITADYTMSLQSRNNKLESWK